MDLREPRVSARWRGGGAALVIALAVALVFAQTLGFAFVQWDDETMLTANPRVTRLSADNLRWMFTDASYNRLYMPLGWLAFALSWAAFGADAGAHHAINLLLHLASAVLVFAVLREILARVAAGGRGAAEGDDAARVEIALLGALLWAVHPLRAEVGAWVAARVHAQAAVLVLLSLGLYLRAEAGRWRDARYVGAVVAYGLSLLVFPSGLMLPAALLVVDVYVLRRLEGPGRARSLRRMLLDKVPFGVAMALPVAVSLWGRAHTTTMLRAPALAEFGPGARAMQALYVWAHYLAVQLWPAGLTPVPTRLVSFRPLSAPFVGSAALVGAVSAAAFALRRRAPALWATWLCHLVLLLPFLGLSEHPHFATDRYAYLVSVAWAALTAIGMQRARQRWRAAWDRGVPRAAAAGAVAVLAVLTFQQVWIWQDSLTLFDSMLGRMGDDPYRSRIYWRIGMARQRRGEFAAAIGAWDAAIRADPGFSPPWVFKAALQARMGDAAGAKLTETQSMTCCRR